MLCLSLSAAEVPYDEMACKSSRILQDLLINGTEVTQNALNMQPLNVQTDKVNKASLNPVEHWYTSNGTYASCTVEAIKDEQTLENSEEEREGNTPVHEEIDIKEFKLEFLTDDINETDKVNKASLNPVEHCSTSNGTYASCTVEAIKDEQTLENSEEEREGNTPVHEEIDIKEFKLEFLTDDINETDKVNKASLNPVEHCSTSNGTYASCTVEAIKDEQTLENSEEEREGNTPVHEEIDIKEFKLEFLTDDINETDKVNKASLNPVEHCSTSNGTYASCTVEAIKDEQTLENSEEEREGNTPVHEEIDIKEFKLEFLTDDINETDKVNKASLNPVEHCSTSNGTYASSTIEAIKDEQTLENSEEEREGDTHVHEEIDIKEFKLEFLTDDMNETDKVNKASLNPVEHCSTSNGTYASSTIEAIKDEQTLENSEEEREGDTHVHEEIDIKEFKLEFLTDDMNETDKVNKASLNPVEHCSTSNGTYASSTIEAIKDEQTLENSEEEREGDTHVHEEIDIKEFKLEFLTDDINETDKVNKASLNPVEHCSTSNGTYASSTIEAIKDEQTLENSEEEREGDTHVHEEIDIKEFKLEFLTDDMNETDKVNKASLNPVEHCSTSNGTYASSTIEAIKDEKILENIKEKDIDLEESRLESDYEVEVNDDSNKTENVRESISNIKADNKTHLCFYCDICNKIFNKKRNLVIHLKIHTGEKSYSCNRCDKIFTSKNSLTSHMRIHTEEKPYSCNRCDRRFSHISNISRHMRIHTGEKPYSCDRCDKRFCERGTLTRHMLIHTGEKPYSCDRCDQRFSQINHLTIHMRMHTGEKPYSCDRCDKRFSQINHLTIHMRMHTGEKPYSCNRCDKRFSQIYHLTIHMRMHTGEKPYSCNRCDKRFSQINHLTMHMRIHTGEKPYSCDRCDKRFCETGSLTRHMRIHTGEKPYSCDRCDKRFCETGSLTRHMRIHTGEKPYSCDRCDKRFCETGNLTRHMRIHSRE